MSDLIAAYVPSPEIEAFLTSKPFSENYRLNVRSTLEAAERQAGKPLVEWSNADGLAFKQHLEGTLKNRSPVVKWQQVASFFRWAGETGRTAVHERTGKPLATAGIEMTRVEDPKMPTLRMEDFARLDDYLAKREYLTRKEQHTRREKLISVVRERVEDHDFLRRTMLLQWRKGLRGGELLPTIMTQPKTLCDCPGTECPRRPGPHDFKLLPDGLVSIRVKGEPKRVRFALERFDDEELVWLREIIGKPRWVLRTYDDKLKALQAALQIRLVDRSGNPVPIEEAPLASHTIRRTVAREMSKAKIPEAIQNKRMHWTTKSLQSRRYGELSPEEVDEAVKDVLDVERVKRQMRKRQEETAAAKRSASQRRGTQAGVKAQPTGVPATVPDATAPAA